MASFQRPGICPGIRALPRIRLHQHKNELLLQLLLLLRVQDVIRTRRP
jgi:hypothetical protein